MTTEPSTGLQRVAEPALPSTAATAHEGRRDREWNGDAVLGVAALGVFLANLAISLGMPNQGIWETDRAQGYLIHLAMSLAGLYLVVPVVVLLAGDPLFAPTDAVGLARTLCWLASAFVLALVARGFKGVPAGRRHAYAYLIAAQLSGVAVSHWSTLGN